MAGRDARHRSMARQVRDWGRRAGLRLVPHDESSAASTLTAFYYPEGRDDAWLRWLRDVKGLELAPSNDARLAGRYFRVGHLGDIPQDYLDRGLAILEEALHVHAMEATQ